MTLLDAIVWLACVGVIGFAGIWAFARWPGRSRVEERLAARAGLPADFSYEKDDPRDVVAPGGPDHRR